MKIRFFDTGFAISAGYKSHLSSVVRFSVENQDSFFTYGEVREMASPIRTILKSPTADFFARLLSSSALENFASFYISEKTNVPEMLATPSIVIDLAHAGDATRAADHIQFLRNKVLVNLTSTLKPDRAYGGFIVNSIDAFQNLFIKGHLSASYHDSDGWLSASLAEFVVRTYSIVLSSMISKYYSLSLSETLKVTGILALYIAQKLSRKSDDPVFPPLFRSARHVGSGAELKEMADFFAETSVHGLDLVKVSKVISEITPRLNKFDLKVFLAICGNIGPDWITTRIALEFPPYWFYILLLSLSGFKIPLIFHMTANRLINEGRTRFLQQVMTDPNLFDLNR